MEQRNIKRGEIWYISAPNSNPASVVLGRPAVVMTSDKGCNSPEIAVVYCTTNTIRAGMPENALLTSPNRKCMARCNGTALIPRGWFQSKMCSITEDEMKDIERGLLYSLDISVDEEMRGLKRQLSFYKALYHETLNELARKTMEEDLSALIDERNRRPDVVYVGADDLIDTTPPEPPVSEFATDTNVSDKQDEPEPPAEPDLPQVPVKWILTPEEEELARELEELEQLGPAIVDLSEPEPVEVDEPTAPKKLVNVNTASWWQMHRHFEIDQDTAREIVGEKIKKGGRFRSVEEVLSLRCLSKKDVKKMEGRIAL